LVGNEAQRKLGQEAKKEKNKAKPSQANDKVQAELYDRDNIA